MKKVLLTTAAALAISSSAFADFGDKFYLRADLGLSKFDKVKAHGRSHKTKFDTLGIDFGVGTYVADNMRTELVYNHAFDAKDKSTANSKHSKAKPQAQALVLRGLVDFADLGMGKLFAGAGLGWAKTSAKYSTTGVATKAKAKNNLAWSAHFGAGFDLADGVKADVAYSFRDYGKTKAFDGKAANNKTAVRAHNLSAGVRFDI
jgi:opacity protein-like surface antigen